ncbi:heterokaryon incompatibility protein-domain-containing protein [Cercophora newfieldiana]|uniref:Heterokaryon incompatibility protein-domain-containing protein n=1 Tax=Cercophora newfieldiana TaxID=92897 RepID=A0AA39Y5E9_9PEZI|nr:heterokaryon incompatibility protein-domain-containing protein [Cercophora newfieldiana]
MSFSLFRPVSPPTDGQSTGRITAVPHNATTAHQLTWKLAENWPLCHKCRSLINSPPVTGQRRTYWGEGAKRYASGKCILCRAMLQAIDRFEDHILKRDDIRLRIFGPGALNMICIDPHGRSSRFISLQQGLGTEDTDDAEVMYDHKSDQNGQLTPATISFIQQRLASCLTDPAHSNCGRIVDFAIEWPRRMLKITGEHVVLVDFDDSMIGKFAALSYCWGSKDELHNNPPLTLNASTLNKLQSGIETCKLPLTLKQAIMICGYLSLEHVWIDALCIMQGDANDWASESKKMATVYALSTVTIIAASSTSCHSGFLTHHPNSVALNTPPLHVPARLVVQRESKSGFHSSIDESRDPISKRGWTLQEELLSTRYVKFTADDVQWKCNSGTECMCRQPTAAEKPFVRPDETYLQCREEWLNVVEGFAHRLFSDDRDRLQALSGLARMSQIRIQSTYLAGNWRNHLDPTPGANRCALAWRVQHSGRCYGAYIAPSFSWASIDAPIIFESCRRAGWLYGVVDAGTTPVSPSDPFGKVLDGFLTIRGPILRCSVQGGERLQVKMQWNFEIKWYDWYIDCPLRRNILADGHGSLSRHPQGGTQFEETPAHVLFLHQNSIVLHGLLLGRELSREGYQRIGFVIMVLRETDYGATDRELASLWDRSRQLITIY